MLGVSYFCVFRIDIGAGAATAMATNASPAGSGKTAAKMAIEHSATVDKGLKMKIKRTKPGTKTSEAKHEIVKSNEQNGNADGNEIKGAAKHPSNTPAGGGGGGGMFTDLFLSSFAVYQAAGKCSLIKRKRFKTRLDVYIVRFGPLGQLRH